MNKRILCSLLTTLISVGCLLAATTKVPRVEIGRMTVEYETAPLGLDMQHPRFSWQMKAAQGQRACRQTAYRIHVTDDKGTPVWDTGRRKGSAFINIAYDGQPLKPSTLYTWTLTVWNNKGSKHEKSSTFETGLMSSDALYAGWSGAQWIGGDDNSRVLYAPYLSVFRLGCTVQLDAASGTERAGLVYGANEERMADANKNLYHMQRGYNENYCEAELDIRGVKTGKEAHLNVYRVGYHPSDDADKPLASLTIPARLLNKDNCYEPHKISLSSVTGTTVFAFDGHEIGTAQLNPMGNSGDFISFPALCDIGFHLREKQKAVFSDVEVRNYRSPSNVLASYREKTTYSGGDKGLLHTFDPSRNTMTMLRTEFAAKNDIARARLYVTARGIYDIYMNGKRVNADFFNPGLTQYNRTHLYQTFDVTPFITSGRNALGAVLSEGWWSGGITYTPENWNMFGDRQSLLTKLVITYKDGREQTIASRPEDWSYSVDGPLVYGSFFQGEVYDARREAACRGWAEPGFDDTAWKPAKSIGLEGNVATVGLQADYSHMKLLSQNGLKVAAIDTLTAVGMDEVKPHLYVYDMGQNMAAVPRLRFSGLKPGTVVRIRFAEVKYPSLPAYAGNEGMIMLENIRSARSQDIYIAKGGDEEFLPRFTFHGFRYMEISGLDAPLPLDKVQAVALSSLTSMTAGYHTSNDKVNRLWENIQWSARSNFLSIPTDCPQRNERLGWAGDISVFSRTATYLAHVPAFLRSYLRSMRDIQPADGRFPDIAPLGGGFGGLLWGSAGITVPWECFRQYADTALLAEHYPAMKRYISYIRDHYIDKATGIIVQMHQGGDLGDWLSLEYDRCDKSLLWECYFIYDLDLMARMASVLGFKEDAQEYARLAGERRAFFKRTYLQPGTLKTVFSDFVPERKGQLVDIQTSYVLPLAFGIVDNADAKVLAKHLAATVTRANKTDQGHTCEPYSLMTGFIGTAWINRTLSDNGHSDLAYRLLQQTSYPSWLYSVEQGATTIWERLNSYTHTDGFGGNNSMNSFNHYSFGAVGSWMINYSAGIESEPDSPGMAHFILRPQTDPTGQITNVDGYVSALAGDIRSSWKTVNGIAEYRLTVPANTSATLYLPLPQGSTLREAGKVVKTKGKGFKLLERKDGKVKIDLQSGDYCFEVIP